MKKALFILEQLVQRDHIVRRAEVLLALFDSVDILTFAHNQGQIRGEMERCKIYSSSFFKNETSIQLMNKKKLRKYLTAKTLAIPSHDYDVVLCFSSGWASLVNVSKVKKKFAIIESWDFSVGKLLSFEMQKSLEKFDKVMTTKKNIASYLGIKSLVPFGFSSKEYSHDFVITEFKYFVVNGENLSLEKYQILKKQDLALKVYANFEIPWVDASEMILGDCDAVHLSALSKGRVWMDFGEQVNTDLILGALALGVPVWSPKEESFGDNEFIFRGELSGFESWLTSFDPEKARRFALTQNERAYKREVWKELCKNSNLE